MSRTVTYTAPATAPAVVLQSNAATANASTSLAQKCGYPVPLWPFWVFAVIAVISLLYTIFGPLPSGANRSMSVFWSLLSSLAIGALIYYLSARCHLGWAMFVLFLPLVLSLLGIFVSVLAFSVLRPTIIV